ncbi:MAG: hypothetical protein IH944_10720 [Armatimonadetes bacterium]|nr:hypothetical protein [Armatimonadota bacterium]
MLTCILLSLAVQQKTFDFDHKGAPVARVVAAMAEAFGEELKADGTMSRDYVIVAFRHTTAERAKELLADALNASWVEKDGELILHRSHAQELEDGRTDLEVLARFIRAIQEELEVPDRLVGEKAIRFFKTLYDSTGTRISVSVLETMTAKLPGSRAVARLVRELDAEFLAKLPLRVPIVFSVAGGFGKRQLPSSARAVLGEFIQDQNGLVDLLELRAATVDPLLDMGRVSTNVQDVRVTIMLTRTGLRVRLTSPKIDERRHVDVSLSFEAPSDLYYGSKQWPDGLDGLLNLSAIAMERTWLRPPTTPLTKSPNQPSKELLEVYLNPKEHDFLELAISEIVKQAADQSGKSFVAVPYDWTLDIRLSRYKEISLEDALDLMFLMLYQQVELADAVVVTPMTPLLARQGHVGRREFANSLKAFRNRSRDTLSPLADLYASCSSIRATSILSFMTMLSRTISTTDYGSLDLLAFYAKMNEGERSRARTGGAVFKLVDLDEEMLVLVASAYGHRLGDGPGSGAGAFTRRISGWNDGAYDRSRQESRWLRDLASSEISIRVETVRMSTPFYVRHDTNFGFLQASATSIGRLAGRGAAAQRAGLSLSDEPYLYRIVEEQGILMSVISGGSEVHLTSYFVPAIYEGDEMVPLNDLPKSFRDQYQAALEVELRKLQDPPPLSAVQWALLADTLMKNDDALRFPSADRRIRLTRQ